MMRNILLAATAALLFSSVPAHATVVIVGDGWTPFEFRAGGSPLKFSSEFVATFSVPQKAVLKITDLLNIGDIFQLEINGVLQSPTSTPGTGPELGTDADASFASGYYSRGEYVLAAGNYTVTGIALAAPFEAGSGGLRVDLAAVPEPATWAFMILGFGMVGGAMRSRQRTAVRVAYA